LLSSTPRDLFSETMNVGKLFVLLWFSPTIAFRQTGLCYDQGRVVSQHSFSPTTVLSAKKSKKSGIKPPNQRTAPSSGFGGAAKVQCPCGAQGTGATFDRCCRRLHSSESVFGSAPAEAVVRARYSAFARRNADFLMGSTHPLNKQHWRPDFATWKKDILINCYDNFELTQCNILREEYHGEKGSPEEKATVEFEATMTHATSKEQTFFCETSTFQRAGTHIMGGGWLYLNGVIDKSNEVTMPSTTHMGDDFVNNE